MPIHALSLFSNPETAQTSMKADCHISQAHFDPKNTSDKNDTPCTHGEDCQAMSLCCLLAVFESQENAKPLYRSHTLQKFCSNMRSLGAILPLEKPPKFSLFT